MFDDDPVERGYAKSLARPGGNMTGMANMLMSLHVKRLDLLIEALPSLRVNPSAAETSSTLSEFGGKRRPSPPPGYISSALRQFAKPR